MSMNENAIAFREPSANYLGYVEVLDGAKAKDRADARRADGVRLTVAILAALVYLLAVAFVEAKITTVGGEINALQAQIAAVEHESAVTDLAIGAKSSLPRIESYAMTELGMVYPQGEDVYYLDQDRSLAIAQGLAGEAEAPALAETEPRPGEASAFLSQVGAALKSFFTGNTALAAEDSQ